MMTFETYQGIMKKLFFAIALLSILSVQAKSFRTLSSSEPFEISTVIETEGFQNVHLLAKNKSEVATKIPLVLYYIINQDTIKDFFNFQESIIGSVKTLFLLPGDSLKIQLMIHNPSDVELKIKGNLSLKEPMVLSSNSLPNQRSFNGEYWDLQQPCIFKVNKTDTTKECLLFDFEFTENYLYDNFYVQINIIGPDSLFESTEVAVVVNSDETIDYQVKSLSVNSNSCLKSEGKYIIELVPLMSRKRINGIKSAGFKRVIK